jgi:hypothetical protein
MVFANDHVLNARPKGERKKTLETRRRGKAAFRCKNCGPVHVFKTADGNAAHQIVSFRHVHGPSLNVAYFLANSLLLLYETDIAPKIFPPEKKFSCKTPSPVEEPLCSTAVSLEKKQEPGHGRMQTIFV